MLVKKLRQGRQDGAVPPSLALKASLPAERSVKPKPATVPVNQVILLKTVPSAACIRPSASVSGRVTIRPIVAGLSA